MSLYLLAIGCNYRGQPFELPDCELDSENIVAEFGKYAARVQRLERTDVNPVAIRKAVADIAKRMKTNDAAACYYSGHGTTQRVGQRNLQGIVMNDGSVLWETELRPLLAVLPTSILIADSCFSGGLARNVKKHQLRRFVPFSKLGEARSPVVAGRLPKRRYDYFAACSENETAASTGTGGAFTNAALPIVRASDSKLTMRGLHQAIRKVLPNADYNQTPQFVASDQGFAQRTLGSFVGK